MIIPASNHNYNLKKKTYFSLNILYFYHSTKEESNTSLGKLFDRLSQLLKICAWFLPWIRPESASYYWTLLHFSLLDSTDFFNWKNLFPKEGTCTWQSSHLFTFSHSWVEHPSHLFNVLLNYGYPLKLWWNFNWILILYSPRLFTSIVIN